MDLARTCVDVARRHLLPGGVAAAPARHRRPGRDAARRGCAGRARASPRCGGTTRRAGRGSTCGQVRSGGARAAAPCGCRRTTGGTPTCSHRHTALTGRVVRCGTPSASSTVVAAQQHRPAGAERRRRGGRTSCRPLRDAPARRASRRANRSSRSRQVNAPNHTSGSSSGSSASRPAQIVRTASCSCTASASTCSA